MSRISQGLMAGIAGWAIVSAAMGQEPADPYSQVERANSSFGQGQFDEALGGYKSAVESLGERPELDFNQAAALYKLGQYEPAGNLFARAAMSPDGTLARAARYNRGNCDYAKAVKVVEAAQQQPSEEQGEQQEQPDLNAAVQGLESAIRHYGDALSMPAPAAGDDPVGDNARANIERAQRMIEIIKQMQQQQQQQQQQNQDQEQKQDEQKQDQQQQQDQQQKDQQQKDEQQQDQQQSDSQKDEEKKDQQDQSQEQKKDQQQKDDPKSQDEQQQQQQKPEQQQQKEGQQGQPQQQQVQPAEMSPEAMEPILQAIRDKEKKRREEKVELLQARQRPVLRDW